MRPPDGTFGNRLENGTATGMVGMASRQVRLHGYKIVIIAYVDIQYCHDHSDLLSLPNLSARQEVDLALGPFGVTATRAVIVDYTTPVLSDYLKILGGRGRPEVDPWGFLLPLAPLVWAGLLGALVLLMAVVLLLARCASLQTPALAPYVRVLLQESE